MAIVIILRRRYLAHDSPSVILSRIAWFQKGASYRYECLATRHINRWAGLVPISSVGVLHQSSKARNSDWPDSKHVVKIHLTVFTAFSALPLDWRWYGEDVLSVNIHVLSNTKKTQLKQIEAHYLSQQYRVFHILQILLSFP